MRALALSGASLLMTALMNAQSVSAATAPPAPVVLETPSTERVAPPIFSSMSEINISVRPMRVTMRLGQQTLWAGVLNVGGRGPARVSLSEAADDGLQCARLLGYGQSANRQVEISILVSRNPRERDGPPIYNLTARYVRPPVDSAQCDGSRTVALDQRFAWERNETLSFVGDGGLSVTIGRP